MDRTSSFRLASASKRALIILVNSLTNIILVLLSFYVIRYCFNYDTVLPQLGYFSIWLASYIYINSAFGLNPGALVFGAKIVDEEGKYITAGHALFRNFPFLLSMIIHTAMLIHTLSEVSLSYVPQNWYEIIEAYQTNSPFFFQLLIGIQIFVLLDFLSVLFNSQKRAIRDFLADSYLIERGNYYRITVDRTRFSGNYYHKSAEEKVIDAEKDKEFTALNLIMEIPEIMKEVKRVNYDGRKKITAKILSKPSDDSPYFVISLRENGSLAYTFRVLLDKMLVEIQDNEQWLKISKWRKKYKPTKDIVKSYLLSAIGV